MRVLVTGGPDFADRDQVFDELDKLHGDGEISLVYLGALDVSNDLARQWAKARGVDIEITTSPRPDILLAFHGASDEVIARAKAARVYVEIIPTRLSCEHTNPAAWTHKTDDKGRRFAECPHCRKFMGYVHQGGKL